MEFFPPQFLPVISSTFTFILFLILMLNFFSLPANWLILACIALWLHIWLLAPKLTLLNWFILLAITLLGEFAEIFIQAKNAKKFGASGKGTFASIIGAILGAIILAPVFWGLGALLGALLGAWLSCFLVEKLKGQPTSGALKAAYGAMLGRFLGSLIKFWLGFAIIFLASQWLFPHVNCQPESSSTPNGEELHV